VAILPHLLLALALTFFLAYQARSLTFILKSHRAHAAARGRLRGATALLWMGLPVLVVIALAARSWVAVLDVDRPAVASSAMVTPASSGRSMPSAP
jgi:hypothetical protein